MIEKRTAQRHRVLKGGTIAFGSGGGISCIIRNMSSGGVAVDLADRVRLPPSFMLLIQRDHFVRRCREVWRHEKRVGLAFS